MAKESAFTLPGMETPEQIRARIGKAGAADASAFGLQFANNSGLNRPRNRMAAQIGASFGQGLMSGYEGSKIAQQEIQKSQAIKAIIDSADFNDYKSLEQVANRAASVGHPAMAEYFADKANELKKNDIRWIQEKFLAQHRANNAYGGNSNWAPTTQTKLEEDVYDHLIHGRNSQAVLTYSALLDSSGQGIPEQFKNHLLRVERAMTQFSNTVDENLKPLLDGKLVTGVIPRFVNRLDGLADQVSHVEGPNSAGANFIKGLSARIRGYQADNRDIPTEILSQAALANIAVDLSSALSEVTDRASFHSVYQTVKEIMGDNPLANQEQLAYNIQNLQHWADRHIGESLKRLNVTIPEDFIKEAKRRTLVDETGTPVAYKRRTGTNTWEYFDIKTGKPINIEDM